MTGKGYTRIQDISIQDNPMTIYLEEDSDENTKRLEGDKDKLRLQISIQNSLRFKKPVEIATLVSRLSELNNLKLTKR
jgi:hypothetical protein